MAGGPSSYKRKRGNGYSSKALVLAHPRNQMFKRRRMFVPGKSRTSGYYGRFAGKGGELKFHDVAIASGVVPAAGSITNGGTLNVIPGGSGESNRIGRKCTIRKVQMHYRCDIPPSSTLGEGADVIRVIVYQDRQCNGVTAAVTDILEEADYNSFNNLVNSGRFKTLMDKYVAVSTGGAVGTSTALRVVQRSFFMNCFIPLEYSGTDGTIDEIRSNNIGCLIISNKGLGVFEATVRLRYSDN